jgi:hypothetical protein
MVCKRFRLHLESLCAIWRTSDGDRRRRDSGRRHDMNTLRNLASIARSFNGSREWWDACVALAEGRIMPPAELIDLANRGSLQEAEAAAIGCVAYVRAQMMAATSA